MHNPATFIRSLVLFSSWGRISCFCTTFRKFRTSFPKYASSSPQFSSFERNKPLSGLPDISKPFTVLGIETSCDDTGVGIVRSDGQILSNVLMSQVRF